jgi:hypothetical protein
MPTAKRGTYIENIIRKLARISEREELSIDLLEFYIVSSYHSKPEYDNEDVLTLLVQFSRRTILEESFVLPLSVSQPSIYLPPKPDVPIAAVPSCRLPVSVGFGVW